MACRRMVAVGLAFAMAGQGWVFAQEKSIDRDEFRRALFEAPKAVQQAAPCADSRVRGRVAANSEHGSTGWFVGGIASGVLGGLIGTGIVTGVSAFGSPAPDNIPADVESACYRDGYGGRARGKNTMAAFTGGLVGTLVWVVIYVSANSQ